MENYPSVLTSVFPSFSVSSEVRVYNAAADSTLPSVPKKRKGDSEAEDEPKPKKKVKVEAVSDGDTSFADGEYTSFFAWLHADEYSRAPL